MAGSNVQQYLFERIREAVPNDKSLVAAISEVLNISEDSSYRRIRGETPLVLDELKELCQYYRLSLDQLLQINNNSTLFETIRIHNTDYTFETFLTDIIKRLAIVNKSPEKHMYYLTKDIPLFYHFLFKPLFAFRYFFWMKSILQHPDFVHQQFSIDSLPPKVEEAGKKILEIYNQIPSTEIWNTECINSVVLQIDYYKEVGFIPPETIGKIYSAVEETIDHLQLQAELGKKMLPGENPVHKAENFSFFYNRITLGDNTILVKTDNGSITFLNFEVLNYMFTSDANFCGDTYNALQNLLRRSTMISQASEKQRAMFFNILRNKVRERKKNL
ncbi:MAG TPA: helix-turn-helix domain-containing protein [Chitinophagaceae bacterium]|nr:helix-turn-helix domain-containing protein [Chitinophagaceae bacterium]